MPSAKDRKDPEYSLFYRYAESVVACYNIKKPLEAIEVHQPILTEGGVANPLIRDAYQHLERAIRETLREKPAVTDLKALCASLESYDTPGSRYARRAILLSMDNALYHLPPVRRKELDPDFFKLEGLVRSEFHPDAPARRVPSPLR